MYNNDCDRDLCNKNWRSAGWEIGLLYNNNYHDNNYDDDRKERRRKSKQKNRDENMSRKVIQNKNAEPVLVPEYSEVHAGRWRGACLYRAPGDREW